VTDSAHHLAHAARLPLFAVEAALPVAVSPASGVWGLGPAVIVTSVVAARSCSAGPARHDVALQVTFVLVIQAVAGYRAQRDRLPGPARRSACLWGVAYLSPSPSAC
jgi:hypothetical protein